MTDNRLPDYYKIRANGNPHPENVIQGANYRFTVITERLIRMEYAADGVFEDRPTQTVWNRDLGKAEFKTIEKNGELHLYTKYLELHYTKTAFARNSLWIDLLGAYSNHDGTWHYGEAPKDLKGTCRTLDKVNGAAELEAGLVARNGYSLTDDSKSLVIKESGWIEPRKPEVIDIYYWGYGHDYEGCVRDFYRITGAPPMLPRYAFGNWWSRYHAYTQDEYLELMDRFKQEDIPFSVAVIDMDWHITKVAPEYGRGWTGYTWNEELFPDHVKFLTELHQRGLKASLCLHPADGVKAFEKPYKAMAEELDIDFETKEPIPFDITDKNFMLAYFRHLHHPLEQEGVDFWWIDWQSGGVTKIDGLDPLWMLNHYHTLDIGRNGKRPLIFSRYSGPGSHRYPVGFSGDTHITWDSLRFQPYFTANSTNIGYIFWSHDIGGHMQGYRDDQLAARWVQLGTFSPINRLHSSNSPFTGKEPWKYGRDAEHSMKKMLKLRHALIPYLYTMNYLAYKELLPMIRPMYYSIPEEKEAYEVPGQFWFGTELIVCPITSPNDASTLRGTVTAWLPEGGFYDFETGDYYSGKRLIPLHRKLDETAVLAREGAIIPLSSQNSGDNSVNNPEALDVLIFPGQNGEFKLYEDEGSDTSYMENNHFITAISTEWGKQVVIKLSSSGNKDLVPAERKYRFLLRGCRSVDSQNVKVFCNQSPMEAFISYDMNTHTLEIEVPETSAEASLEIRIEESGLAYKNEDIKERLIAFLHEAQMNYNDKESLFHVLTEQEDLAKLASALMAMELDAAVKDVMMEYVSIS